MKCNNLYPFSKTILLLKLVFVANVIASPIRVPSNVYYANHPDVRNHPGHYPFISYLTFRNVCDFVIDAQTEIFDPDEVQQGDVIFLRTWYLDWFEKNVHDLIKHPYILITASEGAWDPRPSVMRLIYDPKLAAWFGRNIVFSNHPKLFQLPMGQDFGLIAPLDPEIRQPLDEAVKKMPVEKTHLLNMCFFVRDFGDRNKIFKYFEHEPYCFTRTGCSVSHIKQNVYYEDMAASKFALSPLGFETDCIRTWEAFVLHTIPIVEHTFLDPIYEGLPIVIVEDWREINESFLNQKYEELKDLKWDKAYFDYWKDLILKTKKRLKQGDLSFTYPDATRFSENDLQDLVKIIDQPGFKNHKIYYKGFCSTVRPFQLLNQLPEIDKLYLSDLWLDQKVLARFHEYLCDASVCPFSDRVIFFSKDNDFFHAIDPNHPIFIFLDFTYYRTSLFINFSSSVISEGNFRHSLKKDLKALYERLSPGSCICGNMKGDPYVNKALDWMASEYGLTIEIKNNFWIIAK